MKKRIVTTCIYTALLCVGLVALYGSQLAPWNHLPWWNTLTWVALAATGFLTLGLGVYLGCNREKEKRASEKKAVKVADVLYSNNKNNLLLATKIDSLKTSIKSSSRRLCFSDKYISNFILIPFAQVLPIVVMAIDFAVKKQPAEKIVAFTRDLIATIFANGVLPIVTELLPSRKEYLDKLALSLVALSDYFKDRETQGLLDDTDETDKLCRIVEELIDSVKNNDETQVGPTIAWEDSIPYVSTKVGQNAIRLSNSTLTLFGRPQSEPSSVFSGFNQFPADVESPSLETTKLLLKKK